MTSATKVKIASYSGIKRPFLFVRHGETEWNSRNVIMGQIDVPLSQVGIDQAHEAAASLVNSGVKTVFTSPLVRASKTAEIIADKIGAKLVNMDEFKAVDWGEMDGEEWVDFQQLFKDWRAGNGPKGSEPCESFDKRLLAGLTKVMETDGLSAIVSHGGIYNAILKTLDSDLPLVKIANGAPVQFTPNSTSWDITPFI